MALYTVRQNQNIYDVVVQKYGDIQQVFKFLIDNNIDLNTDLKVGQQVIVQPDGFGGAGEDAAARTDELGVVILPA